ncbi:hypothetical protein [Saliniramus sp.]|uniref:hypothetical protein n=1 Tax=Saliniramus sp. TaxID=2986772 RepID=UPI002CB0D37B|nr:hypothetical protein [Saliniramus sp.]HMB09379.1 hypothetical protein [Saliniramus sp.]
MRQSRALALAFFLTAFILAMALGFAQLSSERRKTITLSHDDAAVREVGTCALAAVSAQFC